MATRLIVQNRIEYAYLSIKDAHDRQYNYMKITIFTLIGMIRLVLADLQPQSTGRHVV